MKHSWTQREPASPHTLETVSDCAFCGTVLIEVRDGGMVTRTMIAEPAPSDRCPGPSGWTPAEKLQWLYAIETCANDAGERGDFDSQEWFLSLWHCTRGDYE